MLETKGLSDSLYLTTKISDIFVLHRATSQDWLRDSLGNIKSFGSGIYSEVDVMLTKRYNDFAPTYILEKISKKLRCKDLELQPYQRDSIKARIKRMIKVFYSSKEKNFQIRLSDLNLKQTGNALIFYTESENKDHEYWQSLTGTHLYSRQQTLGVAFFYACVIDLVSGSVVYYRYHFEPGMDYVLPYSKLGFYNSLRETIDKLIDPFLKRI